ncbi:BAH_G0035870.mRNA.1.CDS.1 [Saccharomyces cerevisiae]|nr:BAH_G0035870.mRNA.1.CDS.1 [Saccharomyces cerevisiae]CAI7212805.1 BAH_G0035870.mRNA.1.CDS.1 [Saccharomyces cerevisiae]
MHGLIFGQASDYWQDQPDNYLKKKKQQAVKETEISFSHLFPLARRYLLSLETAEIPRKIAFSGLSAAGNALCSKAFTLLTSALRHHTIALFEFPLIRFHQTDTPGVSRNGTFLISLIWGGYT